MVHTSVTQRRQEGGRHGIVNYVRPKIPKNHPIKVRTRTHLNKIQLNSIYARVAGALQCIPALGA